MFVSLCWSISVSLCSSTICFCIPGCACIYLLQSIRLHNFIESSTTTSGSASEGQALPVLLTFSSASWCVLCVTVLASLSLVLRLPSRPVVVCFWLSLAVSLFFFVFVCLCHQQTEPKWLSIFWLYHLCASAYVFCFGLRTPTSYVYRIRYPYHASYIIS